MIFVVYDLPLGMFNSTHNSTLWIYSSADMSQELTIYEYLRIAKKGHNSEALSLGLTWSMYIYTT